MTFIDAAVAILREFKRPLHFKKITELAVERDLLSHVGKTPEVTMEQRLTQEAEKGEGAEIQLVRPGVFALIESSAKPPKPSTRVTKPEAVPARAPADNQAESPAGEAQPHARQRRGQREEPQQQAPPRVAGGAPSRLRVRHTRQRTTREVVQLVPEDTAQVSTIDALTNVLAASDEPLSVAEISHRLGATKLALVSPGVVHNAIHSENRNRLSAGKPPRFVRTSEGWLLGSDSLPRPLVDSYASLERARIDLERSASAALEQAITMLTGHQLEAFVAGVLDELGYSPKVIDHDARVTCWDATSTSGLVPLKVVVCLWHGFNAVGVTAISGLRERVRRARATHGVFMALNRQDLDASVRQEAESGQMPPVTLVDAAALAALALNAGVGVVRVPTDIPVLDANWFGHLEDA